MRNGRRGVWGGWTNAWKSCVPKTQTPLAQSQMSTGDLILQWLTQMRQGSWAAFVRAFSVVDSEGDDIRASARRMSSRLSDLAHADFFVDGGNTWRTLQPLFGGRPAFSDAVICGGRNPNLIDEVGQSCADEGCTIQNSGGDGNGPDLVRVLGDPEQIERVARRLRLPYVPDLAGSLAARLLPIAAVLESAPLGTPPINWAVRSFDITARRWIDGMLPNTAYEYLSRHGARRHLVRGPRRRLLLLDRPTAVYAAAHLSGVSLLSYHEQQMTLRVPATAPLPPALSRVAAASAGTPGAYQAGELIYEQVPPPIGRALMLAVGQRTPDPYWLPGSRKAS